MTAARTVVVFRSSAFNSTEQRSYFLNEGCFGDDVARWLIAGLRAQGIPTELEPGQEDFGWSFDFFVEETPHCFVVGSRPSDDGDIEWIGWLERKRGLLGSFVGLRSRGVLSAAAQVIHAALSSGSEIIDIRWYEQKRFDRGDDAASSAEP